MKRVVILGSTGSIGTQALEVMDALGAQVLALTAQSSEALLEQQIRRYRPAFAALGDPAAAKSLQIAAGDCSTKILAGPEGVAFCSALQADLVLNGIVGIAGLAPSVAALSAGNPLALANKESLVAGGALVTKLAREKGLPILPVDSEHSAVFQCLQGGPRESLRRIILTASGGAFYGKSAAELEHVTAEDALRHPVWQMGAKITVDSATMFNKGLEVIEAAWLFDLPAEQIDVVVHRQSIVHSLVEYNDGAVLAQLGTPDMRLPIQYALTYPGRAASPAKKLDLTACGSLSFAPHDDAAFPAIALCREAHRRGGTAAAVLNGANEAANLLFRQGKLRFPEIARRVAGALDAVSCGSAESLEGIFAADQAAREFVIRNS